MNHIVPLTALLLGGSRKVDRRQPARAVGIDLGTTTTVAAEARWDPADPANIVVRFVEVAQSTEHGIHTDTSVPSVVAIDRETIIGEGAKRLAAAASRRGLMQKRHVFEETKNDIGTGRVYPNAPSGFREPFEIAGHVLRFVAGAVTLDSADPVDRWVVTVPASFALAQRADTLKAAQAAGIDLGNGALLDEPIAAFIDHASRNPLNLPAGRAGTLAVLDWGGGTCDAAVFKLERDRDAGGMSVACLAVSRFHRLGGGDIDAAIAYEVLLPQLAVQNGLAPLELNFYEKKRELEPSLRPIAEALKIGLAREVDRLRGLGRLEATAPAEIVKVQPGEHLVRAGERDLKLTSPRLSLAQLQKLLGPFLDPDVFGALRTEYRVESSGLAPLEDAVARAGLRREAIDLCLIVGGSAGLPGLTEAVEGFLPRAKLLRYDPQRQPEGARLAVAGGAALHAMTMLLTGKGLVTPICAETLSLRAATGLVPLVAAGTPLPFPEDGRPRPIRGLSVPTASEGEPVALRVEVVAGDLERTVHVTTWDIRAPVSAGEPLVVEVRMDENQALELTLRKAEAMRGHPFACRIENPTTNVLNPTVQELEVERIEQDIARHRVPEAERRSTIVRLCGLLDGLGQREKALELLRRLMIAAPGGRDPELLNRMAMICDALGDHERAKKIYRQAAACAGGWNGPHFNLALLHRNRDELDAAEGAIADALAVDTKGPELTLASDIARRRDDDGQARSLLAQAMRRFGPESGLSDFELGWLVFAARAADDGKRQRAAEGERASRARHSDVTGDPGGELPRWVEA